MHVGMRTSIVFNVGTRIVRDDVIVFAVHGARHVSVFAQDGSVHGPVAKHKLKPPVRDHPHALLDSLTRWCRLRSAARTICRYARLWRTAVQQREADDAQEFFADADEEQQDAEQQGSGEQTPPRCLGCDDATEAALLPCGTALCGDCAEQYAATLLQSVPKTEQPPCACGCGAHIPWKTVAETVAESTLTRLVRLFCAERTVARADTSPFDAYAQAARRRVEEACAF